MRLYFKHFSDEADQKIFSDYNHDDDESLLISPMILEWFEENKIDPYFVSITNNNRVKRKIKSTTRRHYDQTWSEYDSIVFDNESDGILFKLTWL